MQVELYRTTARQLSVLFLDPSTFASPSSRVPRYPSNSGVPLPILPAQSGKCRQQAEQREDSSSSSSRSKSSQSDRLAVSAWSSVSFHSFDTARLTLRCLPSLPLSLQLQCCHCAVSIYKQTSPGSKTLPSAGLPCPALPVAAIPTGGSFPWSLGGLLTTRTQSFCPSHESSFA